MNAAAMAQLVLKFANLANRQVCNSRYKVAMLDLDTLPEGVQIDAFTIECNPAFPYLQDTFRGPRETVIPVYVVDVCIDGDVTNLGTFFSPREAVHEVFRRLADDHLHQILEEA